MSTPHSKFVWFDLLTSNIAVASDFYRDVIGWDIRDAQMPGREYSLITMGHTMIGGVTKPAAELTDLGGALWLGYLGVDNVDAVAADVEERGGRIHRAAQDIPGVGRYAVVSDPQGAAFVLFSSPGMPTPTFVRSTDYGRVGWHELQTVDQAAAMSFYAAVFGWAEDASTKLQDRTPFFALPNEPVAGEVAQKGPLGRPAWLHYFVVSNVSDATRRVVMGQGSVVESPNSVIGLGIVAQCVDPQGARFGLIELNRD